MTFAIDDQQTQQHTDTNTNTNTYVQNRQIKQIASKIITVLLHTDSASVGENLLTTGSDRQRQTSSQTDNK